MELNPVICNAWDADFVWLSSAADLDPLSVQCIGRLPGWMIAMRLSQASFPRIPKNQEKRAWNLGCIARPFLLQAYQEMLDAESSRKDGVDDARCPIIF